MVVVIVVVAVFVSTSEVLHFDCMRNKCRRVSMTLVNKAGFFIFVFAYTYRFLLHFMSHTEIRRIFIFGLDILNRRARARLLYT